MSTYFFSAPGRTEISGNHTDHQHGCVLAAAVNLETVAVLPVRCRLLCLQICWMRSKPVWKRYLVQEAAMCSLFAAPAVFVWNKRKIR